jgi:hypothetical protein
MTERNLYRYLGDMRIMGCPIYYDKDRESYCYEQRGKCAMGFIENTIDNE